MAETEVKPKASDKNKEVTVTEEDRAKLQPNVISTPNDAVYAYLNGRIEEDELRKALAVFGVSTLYKPNVERIDAAYERKIPDDLFDVPTAPYDDHEYRMELLEAKENERLDAVKATEGETRDETVAREQAALNQKLLTGETGSEKGRSAADKALEDRNVTKPVGSK